MATAARTKTEQAAAVEAVLGVIAGYWASRAVQVAATLGVADIVATAPKSVHELAEATSSDPDALYRVLRALAARGIFEELPGKRFGSTPASELMRSGVPGSMRTFLMSELSGGHYGAWGALEHNVRSGEMAFRTVYGTDAWSYFSANPEEAGVFNDSMTRMTEFVWTPYFRHTIFPVSAPSWTSAEDTAG